MVGESGCSVTVVTNELINPGTIRAGDGMDGAVIPPNNDIINGGDGGAMSVFAQSVVNDGLIRAGDGGDLLLPATSGKGGNGGDILVAAGPPVPALVLNTGVIEAGNGGKGPGRPQGNGRGGDGGSASLLSASQYINDGGEVNAGLGGDGNGDGLGGGADDGRDGAASISAAFIWDNGVISANGRDFGFTTQAKTLVRGVAGATVLLPVFFVNEGQRSDTYLLIWSNSAGWPQEFLPETRRVDGLRYSVLRAPFVIPTGLPGGTENQVQLSARSQGLPTLVQEKIIIVKVISGGHTWIPNIRRGNPASASAVDEVAPAQLFEESYFLPQIGQ
jgi:hypothetical protein